MTPALLTLKDAAAYLDVAPKTLRRWTKDGVVPVFRDPDTNRCRYSRLALERWLADNCREAS